MAQADRIPHQSPTLLPYLMSAVVATFGISSAWSVLHGRPTQEVQADAPHESAVAVAAAAPSVAMQQPQRGEEPTPLLALTVEETLPAVKPVKLPTQKEAATAPLPPATETPAQGKPAPSSTEPAAPRLSVPKSSQPAVEKAAAKGSEPKAAATPRTQAVAAEKPTLLRPPMPSVEKTLPPPIHLPAAGTEKPAAPAAFAAPPKEPAQQEPAPSKATGAKPTVVAATADRAWVKLDSQRTVIVGVGDSVPGLGTFRGKTAAGAQFD